MARHDHCDFDPIECSVEAMQGELVELRRQLGEATAEIARHHRDFGRIQEILDGKDVGALPYVALQRIRSIVG